MRKVERTLRSVSAKRAAEALLSEFFISEPHEIHLEDLAMYRNVLVKPGKLQGAEARLVRAGNSGKIRVSDTTRELGRYRFSVAHELGHWEMHSASPVINPCTTRDVTPGYHASGCEFEANCFAAELLMPESMFLPRCGGPLSLDLASELSATFQSSLTATAIRLLTLRDQDYAALIWSSHGTIQWFWGSPLFEYSWLDKTNPLSRTTVAGRYWHQGTIPPQQPVQSRAAAWLSDDFSGNYVLEQSIPLPTYDSLLTLLWVDSTR